MQEEGITKYVGKQIRKYREIKGLTQKELGKRVGVQHNTISSYESGTNEPEHEVLFALAETLGVTIDDLFPSVAHKKKSTHPIDFVMVPIVGRISCGNGILAYEDIEGYEPTPKGELNSGEYFYLRAKGDSMEGARIKEGDLLLIRKQPDVDSGDIAAVLIEDEAVLKRVYKDGTQMILQSENPSYKPVLAPPTKARVIGKLRKIVINI